jgi:hypothetical protein
MNSFEVAYWNHIPIQFMPNEFARKQVEYAISSAKSLNPRATESIPEDVVLLLAKGHREMDPKAPIVNAVCVKTVSESALCILYDRGPQESLGSLMALVTYYFEREFHKDYAEVKGSK